MFSIDKMADELKNITDNIEFFQLYRIVEPESKVVCDYVNGKVEPQGWNCYELWNRTEPCVNCTSNKAIITGKRVTKMEYLNDTVTLVYSLPIEIEGIPYSLELADDVTESFVAKMPEQTDNQDVGNLLKTLNTVVTKDIFTGLFNKTHILNETQRLIARGKNFTVVIIDIDHFKAVNDTYGHIAGDEVLIMIAGYIKEMMQDEDISGSRFGGDEFLLILQNKDEEESRRLCEQLAEQISSHEFDCKYKNLKLRISYGIGEWRWGETASDFLERVDGEMYKMKKR